MTDEQLRNALIEAQDYALSQFPMTEWHYEFSTKFHKKMKELIELERHPVWFHVRRTAVILLAIFGVAGILLFGFNEKVRADVIRWISEHFMENEYRYQKETEADIDVSRYTLEGMVPEGYRLIKRKEEAEHVSELYIGADGEQIIFTAMSSTLNEEFYLMFDKNMGSETVNVNDIVAELYLAESADDNTIIVWQGSDGTLFSIAGFLDKDVLISLAEAVSKEK